MSINIPKNKEIDNDDSFENYKLEFKKDVSINK